MRTTDRQWTRLVAAWVIALVSTLGALFFSEVLAMSPCVLCWWQRVAMFPLVLVLGTGAWQQDLRSVTYAWPLAAVGWLVALYHCLLYGGFIPQGLQPCGQGSPCLAQSLEVMGFITIPLLSFLAFSTLLFLLLPLRHAAAHSPSPSS